MAALCTAGMVVFYSGFSAGFANYIPVAALIGSILLSIVAIPLIIYFQRFGLIMGLIGCVLMLPYSLMFVGHLFNGYSGKWRWGIMLIMMPSAFVLLNLHFTVKALFTNKTELPPVATSNIIKAILSLMPILIFILYIFLYGKYWSWEMFEIRAVI